MFITGTRGQREFMTGPTGTYKVKSEEIRYRARADHLNKCIFKNYAHRGGREDWGRGRGRGRGWHNQYRERDGPSRVHYPGMKHDEEQHR